MSDEPNEVQKNTTMRDRRARKLGAGYGTGAGGLELQRTDKGFTAQERWRNKFLKNKFTSSVLHGGHLYGLDEDILVCLDAETGKLHDAYPARVRRFFVPEHAHEYPFCTQLAAEWDKPYLLYVAALFHDVAKGRGGDHSELGAVEVRRFCKDHGITGEDAQLVE